MSYLAVCVLSSEVINVEPLLNSVSWRTDRIYEILKGLMHGLPAHLGKLSHEDVRTEGGREALNVNPGPAHRALRH